MLRLGSLFAFVASIVKAGDVKALTTAEFDEFIKSNPETLVEFYAPWCGHCKQLEPEYEKAASELKGKVVLAKVDATVETELASRFGVRGYPSLKWFQDGVDSEYDGGRTGDTIVQWIKDMTGPAVNEADSEPEVEGKPSIVLNAASATAAFEKLAKSQRKNATFTLVKGSSNQITLQHKGEEKLTYDGDVNDHDALSAFHKTNKLPLFGALDGDSFSNYMDSGDGLVWSLFPLDGKTSDEVADANREMMTEVARTFAGKFRVTYTDTEKFKDALSSMLSVSEFPAIAVNKKAGDKKKFVYQGEMTTAAITQFIKDVESGKVEPKLKSEEKPEKNDDPVKVVVGSTVQEIVFTQDKDVMFEVYAPWCGHCKKLEPEYEKVAKKIQKEGADNLITIAKMDGTANDSPVDSIEWSGFPALFFIKAGTTEPIKYDGDRTAKGMWKWIKKNSSHADAIKDKIAANKANKGEGEKEEL